MRKVTIDALCLFSNTVAWGLVIYFLVCAIVSPLLMSGMADMRHMEFPTIRAIFLCVIYVALGVASWLVTKRNIYAALVLSALATYLVYGMVRTGYLFGIFFSLLLLLAVAAPLVVSALERKMNREIKGDQRA